MTALFTVFRSPLTMSYPFSVIHEASRLMANGKYMVNGQWLMVNAFIGGSR